MNCPNCGHEIKADINYSKALANAINERLTHYGHTKEMNPSKYQAYLAAKNVIALHVNGIKGARNIDQTLYAQAIQILDKILPKPQP